MKRIYIHALTIISLAFAYTKGTLFSVFLYFIPTYAFALILGCFSFFLFCLYLLAKNNVMPEHFSWANVFKIAFWGSFVGYNLQIINMYAYLTIRHLPLSIGFFEDELYRSCVFLFPCLVVGEIIYHFVKSGFLKSLCFTGLVFGFCFILIHGLLAVEPKKTDPSVQKASANKPNVIVILADDLGIGDLSFNGQKTYQTQY